MVRIGARSRNKVRTRNDARLRNSAVLAYLILLVAGFVWVRLGSTLPAQVQAYALPALAVLIVLPAFAWFHWRRADEANRATMTDDEAHQRRERARVFGGE